MRRPFSYMVRVLKISDLYTHSALNGTSVSQHTHICMKILQKSGKNFKNQKLREHLMNQCHLDNDIIFATMKTQQLWTSAQDQPHG